MARKRSAAQRGKTVARQPQNQRSAPGRGEIREIVHQTITETAWAGPLPRPEDLAKYDHVVPGSAQRIIAMAERQAAHRQHLEVIAVEGGNRRANWGLLAGFTIAIVFLVVSALLISNGHPVPGTILGTVDLVSLVGVFVFGRVDQRRERERQRQL